MEKKEIAKDIIDYWYIVEFLNQNDYPYIKSENTFRKTVYTVGNEINTSLGIEEIIKRDNQKLKNLPTIADTFDICLGKIKREACMKVIYDLYAKEDERIEETSGAVAIMGLQMTSLQRYVHGSFNVSPLLWTMLQMKEHKDKDMATIIDEEKYRKDMVEMDEYLKKEDIITNQILNSCFESVIRKYVKPLFATELDFNGILIYQRFRDEIAKERYGEVLNYSNLSMNYYAKDLFLAKQTVNKSRYKESFLLPYITSAYDKALNPVLSNRVDIFKDSPQSKQLYSNVLDISKTPYGKWPSRYSPAFMQQFAINLAVNIDKSLPKQISVNGPPGTGKTTMLKEIIADAIVKKAMFMCSYEDSDDAFKECSFEFGSKINKGYHSGISYCHYYEVDEAISRHSILVASSNNAAVENISKELPDGDALCASIEVSEIRTENEQALSEVHHYFEHNIESDIYYTDYAKLLFADEKNDKYYWGLVSAPLGNRKNQGEFTKVLNQMFFDLMASNDKVENHKEKYVHTIKRFKNQCSKVNAIRKQLEKASGATKKLDDFIKLQENKISEQTLLNEGKKKEISEIEGEIQVTLVLKEQLEKQILEEEKLVIEGEVVCKNKQGICDTIDSELKILDTDIKRIEESRNFIDFLFALIHKETLKDKQLLELYMQRSVKTTLYKDSLAILQEANIVLENVKGKFLETTNGIVECDVMLQKYHHKKADKQAQLDKGILIINSFEDEKEHAAKQYEQWMESLENKEEDYDSYKPLNDSFWKNFFSENEKLSTKAHLQNPWINERYNREREKLLYFALQVNKYFLLSSYHARCNIKNLLMMWTHSNGEEIIKYHDLDRQSAYPYLLQTLGILIPVISTTFASVQRFFEDLKKPFCLGTLMIDEAGQAQPQMALGAMLRCQKTIIVGDPKQVEPVVKDDLDAIKHLIKNDIREPYVEKRISVQELADYVNPFGTYYDGDGDAIWVGSPLVVHRRCVSPMFEISNTISYNKIMKQQTLAPSEKIVNTLALRVSQWCDIKGTEVNRLQKNHYVHNQGEFALKIISKAFGLHNKELPSMFVISPFISVIENFKKDVKQSEFYQNANQELVDLWLKECCGSVHTFQGKEANEVIFLLGCDQDAKGAIRWVNSNIINVAITRAKYRVCIIGEYQAWKYNAKMRKVKGIIDAFTLKEMDEIRKKENNEENQKQIEFLLSKIPTTDTFTKKDEEDSEIYTYDLISGLRTVGFQTDFITDKELKNYHLNYNDLKQMKMQVKQNVIAGIRISNIFQLIQEKFSIEIPDYSFLNIQFVKAFESHMRDCYEDTLVNNIPDFKKLSKNELMVGKVAYLLKKNKNCELLCNLFDNANYPMDWWGNHVDKLSEIGKLRNACCHAGVFSKEKADELKLLIFKQGMMKDLTKVQQMKHIKTHA